MRNDLKELRRRANLTQIELAQKSGIPRCRIQLVEAGRMELRPNELKAIKAAIIPELLRTTELLATELEVMGTAKQLQPNQADSVERFEGTEPKHD